jgi:hypothetical protein
VEQLRMYPTVGVCGLDCGLCPRYYTAGPSRCPGCGGPGFSQKHPSCSFITCCVKKRGLEVCSQCTEFPCSKVPTEEECRKVPLSPSYPPYRNVLPNLKFVGEEGISAFRKVQEERIVLFRNMIQEFDDGRSKSFLCRAAALLEPETLRVSLDMAAREAAETGSKRTCDRSERAKVLRRILTEAGQREGIELRVRK